MKIGDKVMFKDGERYDDSIHIVLAISGDLGCFIHKWQWVCATELVLTESKMEVKVGDICKWNNGEDATFEILEAPKDGKSGRYKYLTGNQTGKSFTNPIGGAVVIQPATEPEPEKGLRYNEGKDDWSLIHYASLRPLVQVLMFGAKKYAPNNWRKGFTRESILNSAMRHMVALVDGQENDPETKLSHAGHIMCNMMFYVYHFVLVKDEKREEFGPDQVID